ncbi:hypothetical protein [Streptococcus acidominimus]|nr:hypothetical protein [Streptococcus acidominimus]
MVQISKISKLFKKNGYTIDRGKTAIGYVSEIEDTASGFQAYVVVEA